MSFAVMERPTPAARVDMDMAEQNRRIARMSPHDPRLPDAMWQLEQMRLNESRLRLTALLQSTSP